MENYILEKAKEWATGNAFDEATRNEVAQLLEKNDEKEDS